MPDTLKTAMQRGVLERLTAEIEKLVETRLPDCGFVLLTFDATAEQREITLATNLEGPTELAKTLRVMLAKVDTTS